MNNGDVLKIDIPPIEATESSIPLKYMRRVSVALTIAICTHRG